MLIAVKATKMMEKSDFMAWLIFVVCKAVAMKCKLIFSKRALDGNSHGQKTLCQGSLKLSKSWSRIQKPFVIFWLLVGGFAF